MKLCPKCGKKFSDDANFCPVDAARLTPIEAEEPAADSMATRYELRERLGGSRTGVVCRAVDKQTKAHVAVKILSSAATATPAAMQRVERELKQLERLQHAGIAKVIASGKRDEQIWVATELVDGARPLAEVVRTHGALAPAVAAELVEHIGEALIEAAQLGVVHHDLAPKNVLLAGSDIKLINFSVPVSAGEQVPGVPEFVSPEQVEGKAPDQRSNIYSLGTLFYFALTGTTPFRGEAAAVHASHIAGAIKPPSQLVTVAPELEAVIMRALERAPSKRFLTVRQLIDEVVRVTRGGGSDLRSTQPMGRAGKPKAELVQTLLGMPGDHLRAAAAAINAEAAKSVPAVAPAVPEAAPVPAAAAEPAPPGASADERSPWAPPGTPPEPALGGAAPGAMAEAAAAVAAAAPALAAIEPAPVPSAPAPTAPTPIAPEVATPVSSNAEPVAPKVASAAAAANASSSASGSRRKKTEEPENKGKFRETLWFKKGELDAAAAEAAAAERERTGKDSDRDKVDSLPMDERYKDDGSISRGDKDKYSLKTGGTQMLPALRDKAGSSTAVSEDELIREMKRGRRKYIIAVIVGVIALAALVALVAS